MKVVKSWKSVLHLSNSQLATEPAGNNSELTDAKIKMLGDINGGQVVVRCEDITNVTLQQYAIKWSRDGAHHESTILKT
jgi:hypothetical protein